MKPNIANLIHNRLVISALTGALIAGGAVVAWAEETGKASPTGRANVSVPLEGSQWALCAWAAAARSETKNKIENVRMDITSFFRWVWEAGRFRRAIIHRVRRENPAA